MKNFFSLFLVVFAGVACSWFCLLVVGSGELSAGKLETSLTVAGDDVVIENDLGLAARGKQVYRELGCVQCHTQQVRRPGYGGDFGRGWGSRQSVARDYVLQDLVVLGNRPGGSGPVRCRLPPQCGMVLPAFVRPHFSIRLVYQPFLRLSFP